MLVKWVILGFVAIAALGCRHADTATSVVAATCEGADSPATYRTRGKALVGDVDADGTGDRVTLRVDKTRPARCRHLLVVEIGGATAVATVPPLPWPGTDPQLLLLAEIDGRPGVEPVITLSPANVYRPGAVFTLSRGEPLRMQLEKALVPELFPLYDEFPAGVDCAGQPGTIVVTQSQIAAGDDRNWDVTRSLYRAAGLVSASFGTSDSRSRSAPRPGSDGPRSGVIRSFAVGTAWADLSAALRFSPDAPRGTRVVARLVG